MGMRGGIAVRSLGSAGLCLAMKCSMSPAIRSLGGWLEGTWLAHGKWTQRYPCSIWSKEAADSPWMLRAAYTSHASQPGHRAHWLQGPSRARLLATFGCLTPPASAQWHFAAPLWNLPASFPSSLFTLDHIHHPLGSDVQSCHRQSGFTYRCCNSKHREMKTNSVPFTCRVAGASFPEF